MPSEPLPRLAEGLSLSFASAPLFIPWTSTFSELERLGPPKPMDIEAASRGGNTKVRTLVWDGAEISPLKGIRALELSYRVGTEDGARLESRGLRVKASDHGALRASLNATLGEPRVTELDLGIGDTRKSEVWSWKGEARRVTVVIEGEEVWIRTGGLGR
jgi:hypothetical protein